MPASPSTERKTSWSTVCVALQPSGVATVNGVIVQNSGLGTWIWFGVSVVIDGSWS